MIWRDQKCPICGTAGIIIFYEVANVPASCNLLWRSKEAATNCPKGDIRLALCPVCTFITNVALEPTKNKYTELYDNSLFYSNLFQNFTNELAINLLNRFNLHNKTIIEVGSGKVDLLSALCRLGDNHGLRVNPYSQVGNRGGKALESAESIHIPHSNSFEKINADFVFSYHELEHINYPRKFLDNLREMISQNPEVRVFFAVPNALKVFKEGCCTDIIYEHVSYFTSASLFFLFSRCGFNVLHVEETKGGIFDSIFIDATIKTQTKSSFKPASKPETIQIEDCVKSFADKANSIIEKNGRRIRQLLDQGKRVVMWGAGARGVTLLNLFGNLRIEYAVDVNPHKQGKYVPGTGQKIVAPEFLRDYQPDYIVLANPAYEKEIREIVNSLEIETEFIKI